MSQDETLTDGLPEAGFARREELRRRAEALMLQADELMKLYEIEGIDAEKLDPNKIPREVRAAIGLNDEVYVSNADRNYAYSWIFRDPYNRFGGRFVRAMQALGWEVVAGDLKEACEHKSVTGERWVSDCLLMRCRLDRYAAIQLHDREKRLAQQDGITSQFFENAARRGVRVFDEKTMPDHIRGAIESAAGARTASRPQARPVRRGGLTVPPSRVLRAQAAQKLAMDRLAMQIRQGTVEGLRVEDTVRR